MLRTKLLNKFYKDRTDKTRLAYKRQRNLCTSLLKKTKREYYGNLNPALISDNKNFWKTVKPFFSDKVVTSENITLLENNDIYEDDEKVANIFNNFFSNVVKTLEVSIESDPLVDEFNLDPVTIAIKKYDTHPSVLKIKENNIDVETFSFQTIDLESVIHEIALLSPSKATPKDSIPVNIIKHNNDIFAFKICIDFNSSIKGGTFPSNQKYADVSPVFKKGVKLDKSNYRPVSLLSTLSKITERLLFYQIDKFMDPKLSMYQCGFRKNMSAQNCLIFRRLIHKRC